MSPDAPVGRSWPGVGAQLRCTGTSEGDLAVGLAPDVLARRRAAVVDLPWVWLRQVHGARVLVVEGPDDVDAVAGVDGDALVTARAGVALAVHTADCAPVALVSAQGVVAVAHAGWRGLVAGVIEATVAACRALGATDLEAVLGPCVGPECYRFGADDLAVVTDRYGPTVVSQTAVGAPALDVPATVDAALAAAGVGPAERLGGCTACDPTRWWSHRARADASRQATVVWRVTDDR